MRTAQPTRCGRHWKRKPGGICDEVCRKRLQDLSLLIRRTESQESDVQTFIHEIRQYAAIQELDEAMLHRLISRIVVGEMKKVDGQKQQEVKIIYNFVGEIPE